MFSCSCSHRTFITLTSATFHHREIVQSAFPERRVCVMEVYRMKMFVCALLRGIVRRFSVNHVHACSGNNGANARECKYVISNRALAPILK